MLLEIGVDIFMDVTPLTKTVTCLVGFSHNIRDPEHSVLLVAQKRPDDAPEVINSFEGQEAIDIWNRLLSKNSQE